LVAVCCSTLPTISSGIPASDRSMTSRGLGDSDAGPGDRLVACGKPVSNMRLSASWSITARTDRCSNQYMP
jgi:hypothetical protein